MEQLGARRAHNPKVTGSSPVPATKDDSSVFFIGESFFYPLYPLSYLRYAKIEIEFYRFDIVLKLGQSLFPTVHYNHEFCQQEKDHFELAF